MGVKRPRPLLRGQIAMGEVHSQCTLALTVALGARA